MQKTWQFGNVTYNEVHAFGDSSDRVIETVGLKDGGSFEVGYYNGDGKPKPIVNISPAMGCAVGCNFCDLTNTGKLLPPEDILGQVDAMTAMVRELDGLELTGQPMKVSIAKTGEPSYNKHVLAGMKLIADKYGASFKYSTVVPNTTVVIDRVREVAEFAAGYDKGSVQLQISLISTDEAFRLGSTNPGRLAGLQKIRAVVDAWYEANPNGRQPNCSLLVHEATPCDPHAIANILPPELVRIRLRKIVPNVHGKESRIIEASDSKIETVLRNFREAGYRISDAGIPTPTEAKHGLAANVTRRRDGLLAKPPAEAWQDRRAEGGSQGAGAPGNL